MNTEVQPSPRRPLENALRTEIILARMQDDLVRAAKKLYDQGYGDANISPAQMSGVAEEIRRGRSVAEAQKGATDWLEKRLEKLEKKKQRTGKATVWLKPVEGPAPSDGEELPSLGGELKAWIRDEKYLSPETVPPETVSPGTVPPETVRLAALRRFWNCFHALHRYQDELQEPMSYQDPTFQDREIPSPARPEPPSEDPS